MTNSLLLTLIWVGRGLPSSCWFSLNKSKTVKAVILAFCSIQWLFIGDIHAKLWIPNLSQSPDIGQNSDEGIYDFRISCQSLINENCCNYRTSNDIDMKLRTVTKGDKRNEPMPKKIDDDVISSNVVVKFSTNDQFGTIWKLVSRRMVWKTYIFINSNLLSYKNWK